MSQPTKSAYWNALKEAGVTFDRHYRDYSTAELKAAYDQFRANAPAGVNLPTVVEPAPATVVPPHDGDVAELREQIAGLAGLIAKFVQVVQPPAVPTPAVEPTYEPVGFQQPTPVKPQQMTQGGLDTDEHAGITLNSHVDEPLFTDEFGNVWYRKEVRKPSFPKPRGRRVLREMDPGTVTETIKVGDYTESFEIPGDPTKAKQIEIRVTLPSYQTGIYKPKNMPFKIHVYNGMRGFDFDDVNKFYGGEDLVPSTIKRTYVSSDLCYDIRTTVRAIEDEYRERVLKKEPVR